MKRKTSVKTARKQQRIVDKNKDNSLETFYKKLIGKTFHVNSKQIFLSRDDKPHTWKAKVYVKDHIKHVILKSLSRLFSRNNLKLLDGNIGTSFSNLKGSAKSSVDFTFKRVKSTRAVKPVKTQVHAVYKESPMNRTHVLASSINRGLMLNKAASEIGHMVIQADGENMEGLRVLRHGEGARLGMQIFQEYVSENDYTSFINFIKWLDDGLYKFRGNQSLNLEDLETDDDDMSGGKNRKGRKGKKSFAVKTPKRNNGMPTPSSGDGTDEDGLSNPADNSVVISKDLGYTTQNVKEYMRAAARKKAQAYYAK